jgi:hypothetical protein
MQTFNFTRSQIAETITLVLNTHVNRIDTKGVTKETLDAGIAANEALHDFALAIGYFTTPDPLATRNEVAREWTLKMRQAFVKN